MRVFIGVVLNDSVKEALFEVEQQLKLHCTRGNFTPLSNFHLTLQFIGDATDTEVEQFKAVIRETAEEVQSFDILLNNLGEFPKKNRSVVWAGPDSETKVTELYDILHDQLSQNELDIQKKPFTPHITLGRNLALTEPFDQITKKLSWDKIPVKIDNITLFESVRINDQLVYRPLEKQELDASVK